MYSDMNTLAGRFPHSEISGSMFICQLTGAYRRLSRPSSPIIAKASTTCSYSLDPITLTPHSIKQAKRHQILMSYLHEISKLQNEALTQSNYHQDFLMALIRLYEFLMNSQDRKGSILTNANMKALKECFHEDTGGG